ncbi:MAG: hypothetical protein WBE72_00555 [Terracidiphilus sp.]
MILAPSPLLRGPAQAALVLRSRKPDFSRGAPRPTRNMSSI